MDRFLCALNRRYRSLLFKYILVFLFSWANCFRITIKDAMNYFLLGMKTAIFNHFWHGSRNQLAHHSWYGWLMFEIVQNLSNEKIGWHSGKQCSHKRIKKPARRQRATQRRKSLIRKFSRGLTLARLNQSHSIIKICELWFGFSTGERKKNAIWRQSQQHTEVDLFSEKTLLRHIKCPNERREKHQQQQNQMKRAEGKKKAK